MTVNMYIFFAFAFSLSPVFPSSKLDSKNCIVIAFKQFKSKHNIFVHTSATDNRERREKVKERETEKEGQIYKESEQNRQSYNDFKWPETKKTPNTEKERERENVS